MFGWFSKGNDVEYTDDDTDDKFERLISKLDSIRDSLEALNDRVSDLEERVIAIKSPAEKVNNELVDAKAQMRQSNEFMQKLIMQLIDSPREVITTESTSGPPPVPEKATLASYLSKRTNGAADKPRLP